MIKTGDGKNCGMKRSESTLTKGEGKILGKGGRGRSEGKRTEGIGG
jgi:hypothetical protein